MTDKELLSKIYDSVIERRADLAELSACDVSLLLKLANRVKKYRAAQSNQAEQLENCDAVCNKEEGTASQTADEGVVKIAVLGSYSIQHFVSLLDAYLLGSGIEAEIYEGEYGGIQMDVLNDNSPLYAFAPEFVLLLMDDRDVPVAPDYFMTDTELDEAVSQGLAFYENLWSHLAKIKGCQILQSNIVIPPLGALGNLEAGYSFSRTNYLRRLNLLLAEKRPSFVNIIDMESLAADYGKKLWFDYPSYFLTKQGFSPDCLSGVVHSFSRTILALKGQVKKCLVLDLDNTLWGGVVGDDGYDGIMLDPHNAVGEAYRFFQSYVLELKNRGVILAVCSKNDENTAKEPFEKNPDMILKLSDIACFVANWEDKAGNIRSIAAQLNIGVDSLVFVDDNPAEREIVRKFVPEVQVIELPEDPALYARAVSDSMAFSWAQLTKEDIKRSDSYVANRERAALLGSAVDYDEYLKALEMKGSAGTPRRAQLERFTQLINKSNQFNLRTRRYTDAEILELLEDENVRLIAVELSDRFTTYGIISCIILIKRGSECFVDTWLMSCRVLKRGVELFAYDAVVNAAKELGCDKIVGEYIPTKKNAMVKDFYKELGFEETGENLYSKNVCDYVKSDTWIEPLI